MLTILAVGHVPMISGWGYFAAVVALFGLYTSIGMGAIVMVAVVWPPRNPLKSLIANLAFYLMFLSFVVGLMGILVVVLFQMTFG